MTRQDANLTSLGGDEAILERVGDPDRGVEAHDPGRPLERVRRPHQGFEGRRVDVRGLQRQQARGEERRLALHLAAEQLHHREAAEVVAHRPRPPSPARTLCSSRSPTLRSRQVKTAWL